MPTMEKPKINKDSAMVMYQGSMDIKLVSDKGDLAIDLLLPKFAIDFQLKVSNGQIYPIA